MAAGLISRDRVPERGNVTSSFKLMLFSASPEFVRRAVAAGVGGIILDWEHIGKKERQALADTQINCDSICDLRQVRKCTETLVVCRINGYGATTAEEIDRAIDAGADEILLPMVRTVEEVETVLDYVGGRCSVGILIETMAAVRLVEDLARLPLSRVYVGLNDLAIERKTPTIFTPLADGTLEYVRRHIRVPFGFGGLTLPDRGYPIPCRLLIAEMARLKCDFSFLRRSFYADVQDKDLAIEVPRIRAALDAALRRPDSVVDQDQAELLDAIASAAKTEEGLRERTLDVPAIG